MKTGTEITTFTNCASLNQETGNLNYNTNRHFYSLMSQNSSSKLKKCIFSVIRLLKCWAQKILIGKFKDRNVKGCVVDPLHIHALRDRIRTMIVIEQNVVATRRRFAIKQRETERVKSGKQFILALLQSQKPGLERKFLRLYSDVAKHHISKLVLSVNEKYTPMPLILTAVNVDKIFEILLK